VCEGKLKFHKQGHKSNFSTVIKVLYVLVCTLKHWFVFFRYFRTLIRNIKSNIIIIQYSHFCFFDSM